MTVRHLVRRILLVAASGLTAAILLVVGFAWLALNVGWELPAPQDSLDQPSVIRARDGTVLARFDAAVDRRPVNLDQVSDDAVNAVLASEDARFYQHSGVDVPGVLRAVVSNVRTGSIRQGGSTITQQYVKNAFTTNSRSIRRKVREAVLSIQLERELSKDEILSRYLNTVYFGAGAYGIEAAALTYFGRHAAKLNAEQGATLAQLLPAPSELNPRVAPDTARRRRNNLLTRMGELDMLDASEARSAMTAPVDIRPPQRSKMAWPYFTSHVRRLVVNTYGQEALLRGGLEIRTTLDLDAQGKLAHAVESNLPGRSVNVDGAAAVVDPATGAVTAMYGGRDFYGDTSTFTENDYAQFNLATQAVEQPGSAMKPIVLAAALQSGIEADDLYTGPAAITFGDDTFRNASRSGYGSLTVEQATVNSVNTAYVQIGRDVGPEKIAEMAHRLGIRSKLFPDQSGLSLAIGGTHKGPSVLDMASAYATLANDGLACPAHTILAVRGPDGRKLQPPPERGPSRQVRTSRSDELKQLDQGNCYQAVDPDIARTVTQILQQVVDRGTGTRAQIDRPQAGKTGTTNDYLAAWFVGYTPDLSLAVWIGDHDEQRSLTDIAGFDRVFGGTVPAVIWRDGAWALLEGVDPSPFPEPGVIDDGQRRAGPAMVRVDTRPEPASPSPSPSVATSPGSGAGPSTSPSPGGQRPPDEPAPSASQSKDDDGSGDDDDDGDDEDDCIPVVQDCA